MFKLCNECNNHYEDSYESPICNSDGYHKVTRPSPLEDMRSAIQFYKQKEREVVG